MLLFKINYQDYFATRLQRRTKDPFKQPFNTEASRTTNSVEEYDNIIIPPVIRGIGRTEIPSTKFNDPDQYEMFHDSRCDTRWPTGIYAGLLQVAVTDTSLERVWAYADFKGKLEGMWTNTDSPVDIMCIEYDSATPDWIKASGADIDTNAGAELFTGLDMVQFKEKLVAMYASDTSNGRHNIFHSTDTVTWTVASTPITTGLLTTVTTNLDLDGGKLQEIGGELVAIVWHEDNGTITFFSTVDSAVWADEGTGTPTADIGSADGVKGVAKVKAPDNTDHLIVGTREGLWDVDVSASNWVITSINSPITSHPDSCRNMVNHNGELWYSQGVSTNDVFQVWKMEIGSNGEWNHSPVEGSPHLRDGLPTADMLGTVTAMASAGGFCYIAVGGGAASRNATIFCHNGFGWHVITRLSSANRIIHTMAVSAEDDGTVRLHFDQKVGTDDSEPIIVENINSHPSSGVTIDRETSSILDLPFIDMGMPTTNTLLLKLRVKVNDLDDSTSGEHIRVTYGKDGEARTVNSAFRNGITPDSTHNTNDFYSNAKELDFIEDLITNGGFSTDSDWTKNSWTISGNVANSAGAQSTTLSQTPTTALIEGLSYEVVFDVATQSAGTVTVSIGGTDGTARSTVATFNETIVAGPSALIEFKAASFTGTIDNVTLKQVSTATGTQSVTVGLRLTLNQVSPATGELQALELDYIKTPPTIEEWEIDIDLGKTHELTNVSYEVIVTNLTSADSNKVLVPLIYGQLGTKFVRVKDLEYELNFGDQGAATSFGASSDWDLVTGGRATIIVTEVVT